MRLAVLALGSVQLLLGMWMVLDLLTAQSDAFGRGLGQAMAVLIGLACLLFLLPALLLAWHDRAPRAALVLVLMSALLVIGVFAAWAV